MILLVLVFRPIAFIEIDVTGFAPVLAGIIFGSALLNVDSWRG